MQFTSIFLSALSFAVEKHRYQRRKDRRLSPYVNHLVDVANILWNIGKVYDEDILIAAILHDTIEDTNTSPQEIEERFGNQVLSYVLEVSDDKGKPKELRKRIQVLTAASKSEGAKQISLADKLANLQDIIERPPANWPAERRRAYASWAREVCQGLRGTNATLELHLDEKIDIILNDKSSESTYYPPQAATY